MNTFPYLEKPTLTANEVKQILNIGTNTTYKLLNSNQFPVIRLGTKYIIPTSGFKKWLDNTQSTIITF